MNTCYCMRLPYPHERTHQCEVDRIDRLIARRQRRVRQDEDAQEAIRRRFASPVVDPTEDTQGNLWGYEDTYQSLNRLNRGKA